MRLLVRVTLGFMGIHGFFLPSNSCLFCFPGLSLLLWRLVRDLLVSLEPTGSIRVAAGGKMGCLSAFLSCRFVVCLPR